MGFEEAQRTGSYRCHVGRAEEFLGGGDGYTHERLAEDEDDVLRLLCARRDGH
jgi:hypothetical protein